MARGKRGKGGQGRGAPIAAPPRVEPRAEQRARAPIVAAPRTGPRGAPAEQAPTDLRIPVAVTVGVSLVAFAVYVRTLAPSIPTGDSGELITVAHVLGIAHPPGYPLFSMLGHLFALLPFGSPAWRVNLLSAVFHAAAAGVTAWSIYRLLAADDEGEEGAPSWPKLLSAAAGGLALAFSTAYWSYAVVAEVFAINSFFGALILLILLTWERQPTRLWLLWAFGLVSGLAATNHHTIVLIAPACLVLLIAGGRKLLRGTTTAVAARPGRAARTFTFVTGPTMRPAELARHGAIALALLLVGLLPYMYLPLAANADPPLNWSDPRTPDAFFRHLTRADYGTFRLTVSDHPTTGSPVEHVGLLLRSLYDGFTPLGCLLAGAGAWWLGTRRRTAGLAIAAAFLFTGPFFIAYANPYIDNPLLLGVLERFYILPSVFFALAVGVGAYQVIEWVAAVVPIEHALRIRPLLGMLLLVVPLSALVVHFARVDQSDNLADYHFGQDMLAPLDQGALFITQGDVVTMVVDYLQHVEGMRPDITAVDIEKLKLNTYVRQMRRQHPELVIPFEAYVPSGDQMQRFIEANWRSRPVYLLGNPKDPNFIDNFDSQRVGFAARLLPKGSAPNVYGIVEQKVDYYRQAHYPTRTYAETAFESGIASSYGQMAFDLGYVLDDGVRDAEAIDYYRLAIKLSPKIAGAYKNLGLLLANRGDGPDAVGPIWEEFLRLSPDDPQVSAVRERLRLMGRPQ